MLFEKFLGSVKNKSKFEQDVLMLKDGVYEIIPFKPTRTNLQNRYLRGWVYPPIAKSSGNGVDEVHSIMGMQFLRATTTSWKSEYIRSTASLTTSEFSAYVENIRNWMATFGIYIPSPEERKKANWLLDVEEEENDQSKP